MTLQENKSQANYRQTGSEQGLLQTDRLRPGPFIDSVGSRGMEPKKDEQKTRGRHERQKKRRKEVRTTKRGRQKERKKVRKKDRKRKT